MGNSILTGPACGARFSVQRRTSVRRLEFGHLVIGSVPSLTLGAGTAVKPRASARGLVEQAFRLYRSDALGVCTARSHECERARRTSVRRLEPTTPMQTVEFKRWLGARDVPARNHRRCVHTRTDNFICVYSRSFAAVSPYATVTTGL